MIGKSNAELSDDFVHLGAVIRAEEDSIAIFSASSFFDFGKFFRLQEFSNWTFFGTVFIHDVSETGGAKFPGFFSELVDLRTSEAGTIFNTDSFNAWTLEDFEASVFQDFRKLDHFHAVAKVWFIDTVFFHRFLVWNAWDFFREKFFAGKVGDERLNEWLDSLSDSFTLIDEGHLTV